MSKRILAVLSTCIMLISLSACGITASNREDKITIYDADKTVILETTDQDTLDYFSEKLSMTLEKANEENQESFYKERPKDALVSYHYVLSSKRPDNKGDQVDFYVYSNYPYITLENIPILGSITWELTEDENAKLQNPESIEKNK